MDKKSLFRNELPSIKSLVLKIGSRILTAPGHEDRVKKLIDAVAEIKKNNIRVVIVSSGAIAHGMKVLGLVKRPDSIPLQQACASVGQSRLMSMYDSYFSKFGIIIGQVLLTWDDLRNKKRYLNLRNTIFQLLDNDIIPIINENDSVGVEEIQFGNNDILGAQIALLTQADLFVNLTDVNGLFDRNPQIEKDAKHIPIVPNFSSFIHQLAQEKKSEISVGGMSTKLKSAEMVTRAGIFALIGNGFSQRLESVLTDEKSATLFLPRKKHMSSRHRWIAYTKQSRGSVIIDDGAVKAIMKTGKSLLPAGVKEIHGLFQAGDNVDIKDKKGIVIGRGLTNFSSDELLLIKGINSAQIATKLGKRDFDEVIHRDNLVVLQD